MEHTHTLVVAHRGLSGSEPANSLAAFAASAQRGVEAIELDVRSTLDGVIVVAHDATIANLRIERSDYESLAVHSPDLCTLRQVLEVLPPECMLDIEPKAPGFEAELLTELREFRSVDEFILTSFDDKIVARLKDLDPTLNVGLLLGKGKPRRPIRTRVSELFPTARLRDCQADFVAPHWKLLRFGFLGRMMRAGYPVYVWTVNADGRLRSLTTKAGVSAIITDRPLEAQRMRDEPTVV